MGAHFFSGSSLSVSLIGDISKMSAQLQWMITRNTSSFSMKKRNVKQPFITEPLHLTNRHCYKFSTLVHRNVIAVEPSKDKNGFIMVQKKEQDFQASPIPPEDSLEIWTSPHFGQAPKCCHQGRLQKWPPICCFEKGI